MPTLTIFAGINGAGKSTLYRFQDSLKQPHLGTRVCPDEILQDFNGDWKNHADVYKSGKLTLEKLTKCFKLKQTFNWELTLISYFTIQNIKLAKSLGYTISLNFIGVDNVEQSLKRIAERVKKGGHGIDKETVQHRFDHQFDNLPEALTLVDKAVFYDNKHTMKIVGVYCDKTLNFFNKNIPWVKNVVAKIKKHNETPEQ